MVAPINDGSCFNSFPYAVVKTNLQLKVKRSLVLNTTLSSQHWSISYQQQMLLTSAATRSTTQVIEAAATTPTRVWLHFRRRLSYVNLSQTDSQLTASSGREWGDIDHTSSTQFTKLQSTENESAAIVTKLFHQQSSLKMAQADWLLFSKR